MPLNSAICGFHRPHLGQLPAFAPALALRGSDYAGDSDAGLDRIMNHAPGSGLVRRQGGQIDEIVASALAHAACARTYLGVEADGLKLLPAHPAKARTCICIRFHGHMLEISTPAWTFNSRLFATAAAISFIRRAFTELIGADLSPCQSLEL
jgi:hypothetical protein